VPELAAVVDRVMFNAHILEAGTQSYRLRTSKTTTGTGSTVALPSVATTSPIVGFSIRSRSRNSGA